MSSIIHNKFKCLPTAMRHHHRNIMCCVRSQLCERWYTAMLRFWTSHSCVTDHCNPLSSVYTSPLTWAEASTSAQRCQHSYSSRQIRMVREISSAACRRVPDSCRFCSNKWKDFVYWQGISAVAPPIAATASFGRCRCRLQSDCRKRRSAMETDFRKLGFRTVRCAIWWPDPPNIIGRTLHAMWREKTFNGRSEWRQSMRKCEADDRLENSIFTEHLGFIYYLLPHNACELHIWLTVLRHTEHCLKRTWSAIKIHRHVTVNLMQCSHLYSATV